MEMQCRCRRRPRQALTMLCALSGPKLLAKFGFVPWQQGSGSGEHFLAGMWPSARTHHNIRSCVWCPYMCVSFSVKALKHLAQYPGNRPTMRSELGMLESLKALMDRYEVDLSHSARDGCLRDSIKSATMGEKMVLLALCSCWTALQTHTLMQWLCSWVNMPPE